MAPKSKPSIPPAVPTLQPPALPREIIDSILTILISLFDHDPAYQWTHLRSLTRFHRQQIDHHFPRKWLPKITLSIFQYPGAYIHYNVKRVRKHTNIVEFKIQHERDLAQEVDLHSYIMATTYPLGDDARRHRNLMLCMGEGVLHGGTPRGGIMSDMQLPGLSVSDDGATICFDWKATFTTLFGEEMLMRRYKDAMLGRFLPTIKTKKRMERNKEIHSFLCAAYQPLRRRMLTHYRDHLSSFVPLPGQGVGSPAATPFNVLAHVPANLRGDYRPSEPYSLDTRPWTIQEFVVAEESMMVHIPGWETLPVREKIEFEEIELRARSGSGPNEWCAGG